MADFPSMVAAVVAAYFTARVVFGRSERLFDALAAGVAAGAALGVKPSSALFLVGPALALAAARRRRGLGAFVVGLLPAVVTLALWKWRGYGYLPLVHGAAGAPVRSAAGPDVAALQLPHYAHFDWSHFTNQLDLLREHFWSGRLLEWLVVAGLIALGLKSRRALALVGGWFAAFAIVKGGYGNASIEDSSLLRILIPAVPAFVLLLAALPFLVPHSSVGADAGTEEPARLSARTRWGLLGAAVLVTAAAPFAAIAAATPLGGPPRAAVLQQPLIPADVDVGLHARAAGGRLRLDWAAQHPVAGPVFYHVFRSPAGGSAFSCDTTTPAEQCRFTATDLGTTRSPSFSVAARPGDWEYRVGVAANWLNDVAQGDVYVLSRPATVGP
jgi:hypothetical protein